MFGKLNVVKTKGQRPDSRGVGGWGGYLTAASQEVRFDLKHVGFVPPKRNFCRISSFRQIFCDRKQLLVNRLLFFVIV